MSTAAAVTLSATGLSHRYGRRATGVDQLAFSFRGPGVVAVTGPNGSGKSTLLRIMAGVLRASAGDVRLELDGSAVAREQRRTRVGLATPELAFYEEFTGRENLEFAAQTHGLAAPREAAGRALDLVGLAARGADRVAAYSSGMKQRLRLAFALLHEPPVLLLDEPGSHLDDEGRAAVREIVGAQGRRALVFVATNDPLEVPLAEQRLALVARGLGDPS